MITSWNVGSFKGDRSKITAYISENINTEDDLVILHEVTPAGYKFMSEKLSDKFEILSPIIPENTSPRFFTAAVCQKGAYVLDETYKNNVLCVFEEYSNRVTVLCRAAKKDMTVVGVHIPINGNSGYGETNYWESLMRLHDMLPKDKALIYAGDFNTYSPGTVNKRKLYELMSKGLVDFWLECGGCHNFPTYEKGTRIDLMLVSGKHFDELSEKYVMQIDDTVMKNKLSDHSAIILKEKTHPKL